ncbi:antibiotic biosynthesis monooxygenase family protein [Rhodoferax sediminis]|uniref:Antibiotic biosynthesis monooxygenase n=1 Tax=Rhodoferax sediminis TaxID=2509614 RepID=A0A515DE11_9BURK|nr:antibiotic biosynthesis monooxygenase [Rhodoferax sediminis]QDL38637.1 antibiotic biosynthesis monooxygenase [Rhodoferax sediminis]
MIVKMAEFHVTPSEQEAFEVAMTPALQLITAKAVGMRGYAFMRCIESPKRYLLDVQWETMDDHIVTYRQSPERDKWRALVSRFYAHPPAMEHFTVVAQS